MMIVLALIRVFNAKQTVHPKLYNLQSVPNFFGVAVYAFMCQHSLPSIITPMKSKDKVNTLLAGDFVMVLSFYILLVLTAVFAFDLDEIEDIYTLNFGYAPVFLKFFLDLFPVFTLSTNFPIISITLRENLKTLFLKEGVQYNFFIRRMLFPFLTLTPPILIAFVTFDVEMLVSVTGSYAGSIIQYIIPVALVYYGRNKVVYMLGSYRNKHQSFFKHSLWILFIVIWYCICLIFVTVYHMLTKK